MLLTSSDSASKTSAKRTMSERSAARSIRRRSVSYDGDDSQRSSGPSRDLHGQGDDPGAGLGDLFQASEVLEARNLRGHRDLMHDEVLRRAVVDRSGIDS